MFLGAVVAVHLIALVGGWGGALGGRWSVSLLMIATFHVIEFFVAAAVRPRELCFGSFLIINHGYEVAISLCWAEFWLEAWLLPQLGWAVFKTVPAELEDPTVLGFTTNCLQWVAADVAAVPDLWSAGDTARLVPSVADWHAWTWVLGLVLVCTGQLVRTVGMWQAGDSFSHWVEYSQRQEHELVTGGIFAWLRHPSYVGWFYWNSGMQLMLLNPVCAVVYTLIGVVFFRDRVWGEEALLVRFFGERYARYAGTTWLCIPCVRSPTLVTDSQRLMKRFGVSALTPEAMKGTGYRVSMLGGWRDGHLVAYTVEEEEGEEHQDQSVASGGDGEATAAAPPAMAEAARRRLVG